MIERMRRLRMRWVLCLLAAASGVSRLRADLPPGRSGHYAVDLFFRTLADTYGPHAMAVVLSGADSGNYLLSSASASGAIGTITPAALCHARSTGGIR